MLTLGLVYLYFYFILPFLLIYVLIYDKEYLSFVATSACVIALLSLFVFFPTKETVLSGADLFLSYLLSLLNIIYLFVFIAYKLNKRFKEQYFAKLFVMISFLNLILFCLTIYLSAAREAAVLSS